MPLGSIGNELRKAQSGRYAVPCFDTFEMMGTQGMLAALEEKRSPAIVAVYAGTVDRPGAGAFSALIRALAEEATVPISLMLDHGASYEQCIKALRLGFSDVMYDGSKLPLEENIATTLLVARAAHAVGACAEAELGHVGVGAEYEVFGGQRKGFTDPAVVERFVAETGVDFLAVAMARRMGSTRGNRRLTWISWMRSGGGWTSPWSCTAAPASPRSSSRRPSPTASPRSTFSPTWGSLLGTG